MPLRVAVLGPKGQCGSCVVDELLSRGHTVVGLSRNLPTKWHDSNPNYSSLAVDVYNHDALVRVFSDNFDAIVNAFAPPIVSLKTVYQAVIEGQLRIKSALLASTHTPARLLSLDGIQLVDEKDFAYQHWYDWPDMHIDYMTSRSKDHGNTALYYFCRTFKWARNTNESKGCTASTALHPKPFASFLLSRMKGFMTSTDGRGLIEGCRVAFSLWEGVSVKPWSFLSPPWQLRDKGVRTGRYSITIDHYPLDDKGVHLGIYNEDMAVAIVDEVEQNKLNHKHWCLTGEIGLGRW
ncbi:hypothetical protein BJY04DRAFT_210368 [Aspergillus karnatakaensis]|uniref:uncharacterized protein n=1 Tax=Aspergillus karnatakaensis TaxID=1810916 RepID=UPI003CCE208F